MKPTLQTLIGDLKREQENLDKFTKAQIERIYGLYHATTGKADEILDPQVLANYKLSLHKEGQKLIDILNMQAGDQKFIGEKNYNSVVANFKIISSDGKINKMSPELRIYNQPNIVTSEADIKTSLMKDKFIVINLVQNQEYFNVRYQDKPFMLWIWVSVLLLSMGGILSFFKKRI